MKLIPSLQSKVIESLAAGVFGNQLWNDVLMLIKDAENRSDLSNTEKHTEVKKDLKIIFTDAFECVLDAAISIGVMWLKSK